MHSQLQSYIEDLRRALSGNVPPARIETILSECASHIQESARAMISEQGLDDEEAFRASINSFGTAKEVAQKHAELTRRTFFGTDPKWSVLGTAALAIGAWNFAWLTMSGPFDHFGETWQNGIAGFLCFVAIIVFCRACRAGHRSYSRPVLALGAAMSVGLVALFSWWIIGAEHYEQGISRFHVARDRQTIQSNLTRLEGLKTYLKQGENIFAQAKREEDIPEVYRSEEAAYDQLKLGNTSAYPADYFAGGSESTGNFMIPHREIYTMVDGRIWALEFGENLKSSKQAWRTNAPLALSAIQSQSNQMKMLLSQLDSGRWFYFHELLFWPVVIQTWVLVMLLLVLDQLVYGISRRFGPSRRKAMA